MIRLDVREVRACSTVTMNLLLKYVLIKVPTYLFACGERPSNIEPGLLCRHRLRRDLLTVHPEGEVLP